MQLFEGFTRQKLYIHASQRNEELREKCVRDVSLYHKKHFFSLMRLEVIVVTHCKNVARTTSCETKFSGAWTGEHVHVLAIAAMSVEGQSEVVLTVIPSISLSASHFSQS